MKKLTLQLSVLSLLIFSGCAGNIKSLLVYETDATLKTIENIQVLPRMSSVGFEWEEINDKRINGINVYRKTASEPVMKKIGSIGNPYATHFVDTHTRPNTKYEYTFTTFALGNESEQSAVLEVMTEPAFTAVSFLKAYSVAPGAVKLLWKPHPSQRVNAYVIERSVNGGKWSYIAQVEGELMVEYVDTYIRKNSTYSYRIFAKSYDNIKSKASAITTLAL
ncbi:MAG: hypothetical protein U9O24_01380 [Campylobacterota bacterium]|nr:hypothetical protein [Campylobacterota bacterium]